MTLDDIRIAGEACRTQLREYDEKRRVRSRCHETLRVKAAHRDSIKERINFLCERRKELCELKLKAKLVRAKEPVLTNRILDGLEHDIRAIDNELDSEELGLFRLEP